MLLKINHNPGTNDFPEFIGNLPTVGDIRDFPQALADRLLRMRLAEAAEIKGVAKAPEIKADEPDESSEKKPASVSGRAKSSNKQGN